jgi:hypothetical protein
VFEVQKVVFQGLEIMDNLNAAPGTCNMTYERDSQKKNTIYYQGFRIVIFAENMKHIV